LNILAQNNGSTSFWLDHFGVALFCVAHFVAGTFLSRPFWREFHENNFFFCFYLFPILIYKDYYFPSFFAHFFSKTVEDFLLIFNKFLSTLLKNTSSNTPLLFFY